jgi:hypothetical protein
MAIKKLYQKYVQKSKVFLFPILKIKKGSKFYPVHTYLSWEGYYSVNDRKLICLFEIIDTEEFRVFEKLKLLDSQYFHDFKFGENNIGIYIFDFSKHKEDWERVLNGKYSKLTESLKKTIISHFNNNPANLGYIESFLWPNRYMKIYAQILASEKDYEEMYNLLQEVGELCSIPDLEQENLKMSVKDLDIKSICS